MRYMLDTNMVIMAMRHRDWPVSRKVMERLRVDASISAVVYAELMYGISKRDDNGRNALALSRFLDGVSVLPFDREAAEEFGDIYADLEKKRMRIGDRDAMIAAHARSLGCTLVTDNVREFSRVEGLLYENWK